ncbi:MAG: hypothetical protein A3F09_03465 [Chlamydiae bacterium RIFCSPHIGHO2_12_FULL_49_11]|nr:MAG: hypothetical protein A3F09_03465 [Chlamydiae bacterium RIFCSPHIGHO2_12_FULL_49_11]
MVSLCPSCASYHMVGCKDNEGPISLATSVLTHDDSGIFRQLLAKEIAASRAFTYEHRAPYVLSLKRVEDKVDVIGYMWDRDPISGALQDRLYPSEERRLLEYEVSVIARGTGKNLIEPFVVEVESDYDFVNPTSLQNIEFTSPPGQTRSVLQFSLGQLDSEEGARTQSFITEYQKLAKKIVAGLARSAFTSDTK